MLRFMVDLKVKKLLIYVFIGLGCFVGCILGGYLVVYWEKFMILFVCGEFMFLDKKKYLIFV